MGKLEEYAHTIIDIVEEAIRKANPEVDKIASKNEGNTLLYGESYYNLEDEIAKFLKGVFPLAIEEWNELTESYQNYQQSDNEDDYEKFMRVCSKLLH